MTLVNVIVTWLKKLPWEEVSFSEWIQIFIGALSLVATIFISFLIHWMQTKHEKEIEKRQDEEKKADLVNQADRFLIKYEIERAYLPWCVLATRLHRQESQTRAIYTEFCSCSDELQIAIMERAGYSSKGLTEKLDVWTWFELLKTDIETYQLGRNILYDNAKYFFRGFYRYRNSKWDKSSKEACFTPINKKNELLNMFRRNEKVTILEYIDEYFYCFLHAPEGTEIDSAPVPPIDYVWNTHNLASCNEQDVCKWVMELVVDICTMIHNANKHSPHIDPLLFDYTDAVPESFEDQYYYALQWLSFAYANVDP